MDFQQTNLVWITALSSISCESLSNLLKSSKPQFFHLSNECNIIYLLRYLRDLREVTEQWEKYQQPRYVDDTVLMAESEEELKGLLIRVKEESENADLKLNIQKMKNMPSGPITSWQIKEKKWKQRQIFFSWTPKSLWLVIAAMKLKDDCSLEEKLWQT